jgi:uncharacterized damage-inducible protein DinB
MDKSYFIKLAHYNKWANDRLYEAISQLSATEFEQDCDVFFKSIQGTLNHILVADLAWLGRLEKNPRTDLRLNDILYADFSSLQVARVEQDTRIIDFCEIIDEQFLNEILNYQSISAGAYEAEVKMILGHVFNHQTHHRGHVHACLTRLGKPAPDMDLMYFVLGL